MENISTMKLKSQINLMYGQGRLSSVLYEPLCLGIPALFVL